MKKIVIRDIKNNILEQRFFMRQPDESQIQSFWVESLKKYGVFIMLQTDTVKYVEIGVSL